MWHECRTIQLGNFYRTCVTNALCAAQWVCFALIGAFRGGGAMWKAAAEGRSYRERPSQTFITWYRGPVADI